MTAEATIEAQRKRIDRLAVLLARKEEECHRWRQKANFRLREVAKLERAITLLHQRLGASELDAKTYRTLLRKVQGR